MKINIVTTGRFHVLDLAIQLENLGHEVSFYSYVPSRRTMNFGLSKKASKSILVPMIPFLLLQKLFPKSILIENIKINFQDWLTAYYMKKSDVLIAMTGLYIKTLKVAKKQSSVVIVERGSKHILEQRKILEAIPSLKNKKPVPDAHVGRELKSYELTDYVAVPSIHAKDSFLIYNYPENKIFVNPYGVDLNMFHKLKDQKKDYDVLYVGNWSYQKGCDNLSQACLELNLKLLHVGAIADFDFPVHSNFTHIDPVDQKDLNHYYNQARVFVLASRQDGFGMVLSQALACHLPVVTTLHTGGLDISLMDQSFKQMVFISEIDTILNLKEKIGDALQFESKKIDIDLNLDSLTWAGYGKRYSDFLFDIKKNQSVILN